MSFLSDLSPSRTAAYSELINPILDNIPLEKGVSTAIEALKSIIESQQVHTVSPALEGRVKAIQTLLDKPELHVQDPNKCEDFKRFILSRLTAKIEELKKMAFSPKLIADYSELINRYLDHIPLEEGVKLVIEALKSIIQPNKTDAVDSTLKKIIQPLQELLDEPQSYVQHPRNYEDFKNLIRSRVNAKIIELQNLSEADIKRRIEEQKLHKETATRHQEILNSHAAPLPGSESHVHLEQDHVQLEQELIIQRLINALDAFLFVHAKIALVQELRREQEETPRLIKEIDSFEDMFRQQELMNRLSEESEKTRRIIQNFEFELKKQIQKLE